MNKTLLVFALALATTLAEDCFGEKCLHQSPVITERPADSRTISRAIES